jgi:hypothetical protein
VWGGNFVLRLFGTLARVVFGFVLASLAAGLVTVLFVNTPIDVLAEPFDRLPKTASETFDLALLAATHIGIFSSLFVLITACIGEWFSIRSLPFYLFAGVIIALLGFSIQYASEVAGQPTVLNNYAIKAFLTVGFFGGFFYWLAAGQFAGRPPDEGRAEIEAAAVETTAVAPNNESDDDTEVVITKPPGLVEPRRHGMPLLERLSFSKRKSGQPRSDDPEAEPDRASADVDQKTSRISD